MAWRSITEKIKDQQQRQIETGFEIVDPRAIRRLIGIWVILRFIDQISRFLSNQFLIVRELFFSYLWLQQCQSNHIYNSIYNQEWSWFEKRKPLLQINPFSVVLVLKVHFYLRLAVAILSSNSLLPKTSVNNSYVRNFLECKFAARPLNLMFHIAVTSLSLAKIAKCLLDFTKLFFKTMKEYDDKRVYISCNLWNNFYMSQINWPSKTELFISFFKSNKSVVWQHWKEVGKVLLRILF